MVTSGYGLRNTIAASSCHGCPTTLLRVVERTTFAVRAWTRPCSGHAWAIRAWKARRIAAPVPRRAGRVRERGRRERHRGAFGSTERRSPGADVSAIIGEAVRRSIGGPA